MGSTGFAVRGRIWDGKRFRRDALVVVEHGRVRKLCEPHDYAGPVRDHRGCYVLPGLIDAHTHGAGGGDFADPRPEAVARAARCKVARGTTGFMASLISSPWPATVSALDHLRRFRETNALGQALLGVHFEGPFLNPALRGAHPLENLAVPANQLADRYLAKTPAEWVRMFTVAPELPEGQELVRHLVEAGAVVALGHSKATYDQARLAMDSGARHATHLFNAMGPLHHRQPGIVGAFLEDPTATVELIPDGTHVHPALVRIVANWKGPTGVAAVTDSVPVAGLPAGSYEWLGRDMAVKESGAFLAGGTLAGSVLDSPGALRGLIACGVQLPHAVRMLTEVPARVLGVWKERGSLEAGKRADLAVLDRDLGIVKTFLAGEEVTAQS